ARGLRDEPAADACVPAGGRRGTGDRDGRRRCRQPWGRARRCRGRARGAGRRAAAGTVRPGPAQWRRACSAGTADPAAPIPGPAHLDAAGWLDLVAGLGLRGPVRELAAHAAFIDWNNGVLRLGLSPADDHLKTPFLVDQLAKALAPALGVAPQLRFEETVPPEAETLHARTERQRDARQAAAEQAFLS